MWKQVEQFLDNLPEREPHRFLVALSGGLDSMCLLHIVSDWCCRHGWDVAAAHFNHQLRGRASDGDEIFVRAHCAARNIPCFVGSGDVYAQSKRDGLSVEEAARNLRYAFLIQTAEEQRCAWILTAHHADDNAETMLLNLIRGTGIRGLSGIPSIRGNIARPLLELTRADLESYAETNGIPHVEDASNADPKAASRNRIRQQVLPVLREINPRVVENMSRAAVLLILDDSALMTMARQLTAQAIRIPDGLQIKRQVLSNAPPTVATRAILDLLSAIGGHRADLAYAHAEAVLFLARNHRGDGELHLPYHIRVLLRGENLIFHKAAPVSEPVLIAVGEQVVFQGWTVTLSQTIGDWQLYLPPEAVLSVTAWRSSDRMTISGSKGSRTLKRLCVDKGISPSFRDTMPVLRINDIPAAAPRIGVDIQFLTAHDTAAVWVSFMPLNEERKVTHGQ